MSDDQTCLKLRVFISSVQKELTEERMEMKVLLTSDPFLVRHTVPCLFEQYPAPLRPDKKAYLKLLEKCQIYVLIIGREYGTSTGLSATHLEYDFAQERQLPTLVCVKGDNRFEREAAEKAFFEAVRDAPTPVSTLWRNCTPASANALSNTSRRPTSLLQPRRKRRSGSRTPRWPRCSSGSRWSIELPPISTHRWPLN